MPSGRRTPPDATAGPVSTSWTVSASRARRQRSGGSHDLVWNGHQIQNLVLEPTWRLERSIRLVHTRFGVRLWQAPGDGHALGDWSAVPRRKDRSRQDGRDRGPGRRPGMRCSHTRTEPHPRPPRPRPGPTAVRSTHEPGPRSPHWPPAAAPGARHRSRRTAPRRARPRTTPRPRRLSPPGPTSRPGPTWAPPCSLAWPAITSRSRRYSAVGPGGVPRAATSARWTSSVGSNQTAGRGRRCRRDGLGRQRGALGDHQRPGGRAHSSSSTSGPRTVRRDLAHSAAGIDRCHRCRVIASRRRAAGCPAPRARSRWAQVRVSAPYQRRPWRRAIRVAMVVLPVPGGPPIPGGA
jgi:hypothetical protein